MNPRMLFVVESGTDVRLVEGLAEHFKLSIVTRTIDDGVEISHPPAFPVRVIRGPASRPGFAWFVLRYLLLRREEYDIAVVQGYGLAALASNFARQFTGKPVISLVCSPVEAYYKARLHNGSGRTYRKRDASILDFLARLNALLSDQYVVLSDYLQQVVKSHGARRVSRIPIYGVDTCRFAPVSVPRHQLKKQLGLPTEGTLIFFSSRIAPEKDSETLLRAIRRLLDKGHDVWLLHRSGGYRQFLAEAKKVGVATRVIASDAVHPHRELFLDYQACDLCVQASREEGLGFSPLEALACETPVVATSVGGLRETIVEGLTGWTYPVGDDLALAAAIADVIQNPTEAAIRARTGRQMIVDRYDREKVFARFVELVDRTLDADQVQETASKDGLPEEARRPLKILLATHVFRKGHTAVYRNTCQRAAYLESRGHACTLVAADDFNWTGFLGARFIPILFPIALAIWLAKREDKFDVAMFHSHAGWFVSFLRRYFHWCSELRLAIMFHGLEPLYYERLRREVKLSLRYRITHGAIVRRLLSFSCRNADLLMCLNHEEERYLLEHGWSSKHRIAVVRNPAPNLFFDIRRHFDAQATRLLFVGQWLPMKGIHYLAQAFTTLKHRFPQLKLVCAGTLATEDEVRSSFPESVRESVRVYPLVNEDELREILANAEIFVFPTLSEGASLALAEAMASALPIVTTRVGAAPDMLEHEQSVLFVECADPSMLSNTIERVAGDQKLREKLGLNARRAASCLAPSLVWRGYADCVDRLMNWQTSEPQDKVETVFAGRTR